MSWKCLFHSAARRLHLPRWLPPCLQSAGSAVYKCSTADCGEVSPDKHIPFHILLLTFNIHEYLKKFVYFWGRYYWLSYIFVQNPLIGLRSNLHLDFWTASINWNTCISIFSGSCWRTEFLSKKIARFLITGAVCTLVFRKLRFFKKDTIIKGFLALV